MSAAILRACFQTIVESSCCQSSMAFDRFMTRRIQSSGAVDSRCAVDEIDVHALHRDDAMHVVRSAECVRAASSTRQSRSGEAGEHDVTARGWKHMGVRQTSPGTRPGPARSAALTQIGRHPASPGCPGCAWRPPPRVPRSRFTRSRASASAFDVVGHHGARGPVPLVAVADRQPHDHRQHQQQSRHRSDPPRANAA